MERRVRAHIFPFLLLSVLLVGCDKGITITMYHELNPGSLYRGEMDYNGNKQGTFLEQTIDCLNIDTYKDNVPDGYFCHYDKEWNITEEGFYKDGLLDSIYHEYHPGYGLKSKCNYSMGKKHGLYQEYFPNHTLKATGTYLSGKKEGDFMEYDNLMNVIYKASFHNDTLIDDEICYYPNGIIKSIRNGQYKDFKEFDSIGRITNYSIEANGETSSMKFPLQQFSKYSVVNSSSLIIDEIFSNIYDTRNGDGPTWNGRSVSLIDDVINITFNEGFTNDEKSVPDNKRMFHIQGGELQEGTYEGEENKSLDYYLVDVNKIRHINPKDNLSGIVTSPLSIGNDTTINLARYQVSIETQRERIPGTGFNPVIIRHKDGLIYMNELFDLTLFNYDGDRDGEKELYIMSSTKTFGLIQIFRIRTKGKKN